MAKFRNSICFLVLLFLLSVSGISPTILVGATSAEPTGFLVVNIPQTATIHFIDVGQGAASLLVGPDFTVLIDAGRHDHDEVVPYLQSIGITSIDLLIGTHPHADHIGQFPQVLAAFPVTEVWMSGDVHTTQAFERALDDLHNANATLASGKDVSGLAEGLTSQLTSHIKGGQSEVTVAIADEETTNLVRGIRLQVRKSGEGSHYDLSRHGTGLQNLVLISIFRHKIVSNDKSKPILAIEEPEAHLHPHAQRQLFKDLCEIEAPVCITTHSPALIERANPLSLCRLHAFSPHETKSYQLDTSKVDEAIRKNLSQLMREGRSELFFAGSIIVVEGQSESIVLPAFAEVLGYDLDREGVSVIESGSNNFAYIMRSCRSDQFGIPFVVVYDTDALEINNDLLKEAYKAGLIEKTIRDGCRSKTAGVGAKRKRVLHGIGWIASETCIEEEVCRHGYLDTVLATLDSLNLTNSLQSYLTRKGLAKDDKGVSAYIGQQKRPSPKIPVARAVAGAAHNIGQVPPCYQLAIEQAVALADPGKVCLLH